MDYSSERLLFSMLVNGYGSGGRSRKKKSKPKKAPKDNWFEEINAAQCKELAKAAKLKVSGSKKDLVQRLLGDAFVGQFGGNKKRHGWNFGNMITLDGLKEECRKRLLQVSGTKFDLVLRITQHERGTGGDSLKRAATEMTVDKDGKEQPVAKKRKPSKPSPSTMYNRVSKKCQAGSQKKYQSHMGSKCHAPDVENLISQLLYELKPYVETDPQLVLDGCTSIMSGLGDNFSSIGRPGYFEELYSEADKVVAYADQVRSSVPQSALDELANVMVELYEEADPYGCFYEYDMDEAAHKIRHGDSVPYKKGKDGDDSTPPSEVQVDTENKKPNDNGENSEDKKPAAKDDTTDDDLIRQAAAAAVFKE